MVLGEQQRAPGLVMSGLRQGLSFDGGQFLDLYQSALGLAHLSADALQHLRAPHQGGVQVFLRHVPVVIGASGCMFLYIVRPAYIAGVAFVFAQPGAEGPAGILVAHAHRIADARLAAGVEEGVVIAPGSGLPHAALLQLFAAIAGHGQQ